MFVWLNKGQNLSGSIVFIALQLRFDDPFASFLVGLFVCQSGLSSAIDCTAQKAFSTSTQILKFQIVQS